MLPGKLRGERMEKSGRLLRCNADCVRLETAVGNERGSQSGRLARACREFGFIPMIPTWPPTPTFSSKGQRISIACTSGDQMVVEACVFKQSADRTIVSYTDRMTPKLRAIRARGCLTPSRT